MAFAFDHLLLFSFNFIAFSLRVVKPIYLHALRTADRGPRREREREGKHVYFDSSLAFSLPSP